MLRRTLPLLIGLGGPGLGLAEDVKPNAVIKAYFGGAGAGITFPLSANVGLETELNFTSTAYYRYPSDSIGDLDIYSLFTSARYSPVESFFVLGGGGLQYLSQEPLGGSERSEEGVGVSSAATRYGVFGALGLEFLQLPNRSGFLGTEIVGAFQPFGATFHEFETRHQRLRAKEEEDYKDSIRYGLFRRWLVLYYRVYLYK